MEAHRVRGGSRGEDPDRPSSPTGNLFGRHHHGCPPIGERATVVELQRVRDLGAREHLLESDLLTEVGLGVKRPMAVVFHRDVGHLLFGGAVLGHVGPGDEGKDAREGKPGGLLEGCIRGVGEDLRRRISGKVQHSFGATDEDDIRNPGSHLHDRVPERSVARGASGLEAGGRDRRDPQDRRSLRPHVELVLGLAPDHVAEVYRLNRRGSEISVGQRLDRRPGKEFG